MTRKTRRLTQIAPLIALILMLTGCDLLGWFDTGEVVAAATDGAYPIVDTGQTATYGNSSEIATPAPGQPFYGQDAQVDGNQPSYVDHGDGTVTDLVTGLMWQQGISGKMSQAEAAAGASSFRLAGYSDWRLPTIKELYSLIDFSGEDIDPLSTSANQPFIDTDVFEFAYGDTSSGERIIDSQWATSTLYVAGNLMFGVNFADGRIKGYGLTSPRGGDMQFYVRYVRGTTAYGGNDFVDNGDGTITDLATGLMWSQSDSGDGMDWEEALAYVQDLNARNHLGYSDWTLPNAKELQSIVDYSRSPDTTNSAAIDPIFHATSRTNEAGDRDWGFYWTSTTHASARGGQAAVYVSFGRGLGYMNGRYVDVHGAGCQRSDPKAGEAIPTGRGPQGDVVRVDNLVRVVRSTRASFSNSGTSASSLGASESPNSPATGDVSPVAVRKEENEAFVLFAPLGGETAYLIDLDGTVVNEWDLSGRPGNSVYLVDDGHLLATYSVRSRIQAGGSGGGIELLTWDGDEVWSFELATEHARLHHDVEMLPNGNVLMISWETKTRQEALAAGLSSSQLPDSGEVWSEMILEYDPDLDLIVWAWHAWDHILPAGDDPAENPQKIDLAYAANPRSEDWFHINSVDYNANLDQIVLSVRATSEIWIIDHNLTTAEAAGEAGDLLYRFGNPAAYGASGPQVLVNQHDAEFIRDELSTGGVRILVFDNGNVRTRPYSRVVELNVPAYDGLPQGVFPEPQIVWEYPNEPGGTGTAWFADHISGSQRLESGNTLICSGVEGRFIEVTPAGEIVWSYVNPFTSTSPEGKESNEVFRCERYEATDPVLSGQDLDLLADVAAGSVEATPPVSVGSAPAPSVAPADQPIGPPGIQSIEPRGAQAGIRTLELAISLNPQFAPPVRVAFTRVALAGIEAVAFERIGQEIRASFVFPDGLMPGAHELSVEFPGRNGEPIVFRAPFDAGDTP